MNGPLLYLVGFVLTFAATLPVCLRWYPGEDSFEDGVAAAGFALFWPVTILFFTVYFGLPLLFWPFGWLGAKLSTKAEKE